MAVQAAPAPAGGSHWCHGFCQRDNKQINIISLHRTTSAKTRATVRQLADQRHIPPNVMGNSSTKAVYLDKYDISANSL